MINYLLLYNLPGVLKTTLWMSSALVCCHFILLTLPHCIKLWRSTSISVAIHCTFPCWGAIGHAIQGLGPIKFVGLFLPNLCKTSSPMNNPVVNAEKEGWGMQGSLLACKSCFLLTSVCLPLHVLWHRGKCYDVPCQWFGIACKGNNQLWWNFSSKYGYHLWRV